MNIDWDRVANDADESPRAALLMALAEADDIETLVIIVSKADKDDPLTKSIRYVTSGDSLSSLALANYAGRCIMRHIAGDD